MALTAVIIVNSTKYSGIEVSAIRSIVETANLRHFFQESVCGAIKNQHLEADDHTVVYLVNLLVYFNNPDNLYETTPDGAVIKPLAGHFGDACAAASPRERFDSLRQLADAALFLAGLFGDRLARGLVDIDYYIAMGGSAYETLAEAQLRGNAAALHIVYAELARQFEAFVDVLTEVGDQAAEPSQTNILQLYELWIASGSPRARRRLSLLGVSVDPRDRQVHQRH